MKKSIHIAFLTIALLMVSLTGFAQKKIKTGFVKFEMDTEGNAPPEMALMGNSTPTFYFPEDQQKMDMNTAGLLKMLMFG